MTPTRDVTILATRPIIMAGSIGIAGGDDSRRVQEGAREWSQRWWFFAMEVCSIGLFVLLPTMWLLKIQRGVLLAATVFESTCRKESTVGVAER